MNERLFTMHFTLTMPWIEFAGFALLMLATRLG